MLLNSMITQVPTKNEEEEKRKAEEAAKKAKEAKKSEGGLIGFLMESVGATGGGKGDKGGIDFSLANLCRCMCFTHEDKDASDSKVILIKTNLKANKLRTMLLYLDSVQIITI